MFHSLVIKNVRHTSPQGKQAFIPKRMTPFTTTQRAEKASQKSQNHRAGQQTRQKSSLGRFFSLWSYAPSTMWKPALSVFITRALLPAKVVCFPISAPLFFNVATTYCLQLLVVFFSCNSV